MKVDFIFCGLVVLLSLLLWAGFTQLWEPEEAAPWRYAAVDSTEAESTEKKINNSKQELPEPHQEDFLAQNQMPAVVTTTVAGLTTGAELFETNPDDQNALVNQQFMTDEYQFNVTIKYNDTGCLEKFGHSVSVPIQFKHNTAALKSRSISELDAIVKIYHQCRGQRIAISQPGLHLAAVSRSLRQRREDEVKYFLIHMRVDKERIRLPDQL